MERAKPKAKNGRDTAFGSRTGILRSSAFAARYALARVEKDEKVLKRY